MSTGSRKLQQIVAGEATQDGAGVSLTRLMGQGDLPMLDPFLLVDLFRSDNPDDYIAGFPEHPHRGFETLTYLLNGRMRHRDSNGNEGLLNAGGMQWMRAGRGVIHSEMPEQENGRLAGIQIWLNLPKREKMSASDYRDIAQPAIPVEQAAGVELRVLAGTTDAGTQGALAEADSRELKYLDIQMQAGARFEERLADSHKAFVIALEGDVRVDGEGPLMRDHLGVLGDGNKAVLTAGAEGARVLMLSALPLGEPVARGGPFVMNTAEEIQQAFRDYRDGTLV